MVSRECFLAEPNLGNFFREEPSFRLPNFQLWNFRLPILGERPNFQLLDLLDKDEEEEEILLLRYLRRLELLVGRRERRRCRREDDIRQLVRANPNCEKKERSREPNLQLPNLQLEKFLLLSSREFSLAKPNLENFFREEMNLRLPNHQLLNLQLLNFEERPNHQLLDLLGEKEEEEERLLLR